MKVWHLFKVSKTPNYDHLCCAIKAEMIRWANRERSWIEEGVYFDNKTINEWIALKFNPGDRTALYASSNKGIFILKCCTPTSAILKEQRRQEEIWEATKGNTTYVKVMKRTKKDTNPPAHNFNNL